MGALWFNGYTVLEVDSLCAERFFNLCTNRGILIHRLYPDKDKCIFATSVKDYYRLKPVVRKTKPHIRLVKKVGFPFVFRRMLSHQFFIAGVILFAMVLFILGRFIWNIRLEGNYMNSDDTLYAYLRENGITYGTRISDIDCEELEAQIRRDYDDIIWVSAAIHGTSLDIDIRENTDEVIEVPAGMPSDIVSKYDGIVYSIVARNGTPVVKASDIVKKGDVLISGIVTTYNESSEPVKKEAVYADGEVKLLVELAYGDRLSREYIKKEYTGNSYKSVRLRAFNRTLDLDVYREEYVYSDIVTSSSNLCVYQNFYLPFGVYTTYHREYTMSEAVYSDEELEEALNEKFSHYLEKLQEKGIQIIENNVTITINDDQAQMSGTVFVIESECGREDVGIEYN